MKEIVKSIIILAVIYLLLFFLVNTNRQSQVIQEKQLQPVILTDTIVNVVYDTVYLERYKTVKLRTTDTLILTNDSIRIDSVFVEVPISVYKLDTTFTSDSTVLNIFVQNKGFDVTLDTLYYRLEYTPTPIKLPKKNYFREHFKFGLGVSTGLGVFSKKPDIFLGVGFYYCF